MEYLPSDNSHESSVAGRTFIVSVNEKGRMTLPAKVRQFLHMTSEPSLLEIAVLANGRITIQGRLPTVAETAGAVPPLEPTKEWKEVESIVRDEVAQRFHDKMHR